MVEDLGRYSEWLDIVVRATPAEALAGDEGPAWSIELRGRLGPLARSKRLRMVRTVHERPERVVFERREAGERSRSPWTLTAEVAPTADGSRLTMSLHYGGALWGPMLERLLADEVDRARPRLLALLEADAVLIHPVGRRRHDRPENRSGRLTSVVLGVLVGELGAVELGVAAVGGQQLVMGALLDDPAAPRAPRCGRRPGPSTGGGR